MHVKRKWAFFSFNMTWRYQICMTKSPYSYRDDLLKNLFKFTAEECKRSTSGWRSSLKNKFSTGWKFESLGVSFTRNDQHLAVQSSVWIVRKYWTVPCERIVRSSLRASSRIWTSEASLKRTRERVAGPSRLRRSLPRSRAARFARPNRRACSQAISRQTFSQSKIRSVLRYRSLTVAMED